MSFNRDFLKDLKLDDNAIDRIMAEHGKSLQGSKEAESKTAELESQVKSLTSQIADRDKQLSQLKEQAKDSRELQDQIQKLQDDNKSAKQKYQADLEATQKSNAIGLALRDAGARNAKAVSALLDGDTITFKDGKLAGLDEQLEAIKKDNDYLFQASQEDFEKEKTPAIHAGDNPNPPEGSKDTKDISEMSYEEVAAQLAEQDK